MVRTSLGFSSIGCTFHPANNVCSGSLILSLIYSCCPLLTNVFLVGALSGRLLGGLSLNLA